MLKRNCKLYSSIKLDSIVLKRRQGYIFFHLIARQE